MKKIIFGIAVLAIAGVVALNVNLGIKKSGEVSLLALANIEALANDESGASGRLCIYGAQYGGLGIAIVCETCVWQFFLAGWTSTGSC